MSAATLSMTDTIFESFRQLVYDRAGISFAPCKKYVLEGRLAARVQELGFDDFGQYLDFLTFGPYAEDELQQVFNRITINETSFFRNESQLDVFVTESLPNIIEARSASKTIRIWSAASSSGEEPYSLAMIIHRALGIRLMNWRVEILGTDISEKVLEVARVGRYGAYSVRTTPKPLLDRYFTKVDGFYQIDPTIQSMVHFDMLNLKDAAAAKRFGTFDIIFCRNVLIYFDDEMKEQCAKMFHSQLANDGYLFIGHSESLQTIDTQFTLLPIAQGFVYIKNNR